MAATRDAYVNMLLLINAMPSIAKAAMEKTMDTARDICKETTAFRDRTGNLRRSIDAGVEGANQSGVTGVLSAGSSEHGTSDEYAGFVELGHYGPYPAAPHPYIAPTMQQIIGSGVLAHNLTEEFTARLI
jgi:hypothetical protein